MLTNDKEELTVREPFSAQEIRYLKLLRKQYRTIQEASSEVAHLRAVLRLPKGTEHFLSDLHGEHAAFLHILHNASGVIKRKINATIRRTKKGIIARSCSPYWKRGSPTR